MPRIWTEEDDKYLQDNWFESISQLAKKFEISEAAIKFRFKKLGINRPKGAQENIRLRATIYREKNKDKVPKEWHQLPSTRTDAKKVKSFFYWDGQTCKRAGHLSRRKTSSAGCWACDYGDHKDKLSREPERREKRRKMFKRYYYEKGEDFLKRQRERKNTDQHRAWAREWGSKKRKEIDFRITKSLRDRLYKAITKNNKFTSATSLVGCDIEKLKEHLTNQFSQDMNWENYGEWHIDHKRPCNSFDLKEKEQQNLCFHYLNLQPLWGYENHAKKDKYTKKDELSWIKYMRHQGYSGNLCLKYRS